MRTSQHLILTSLLLLLSWACSTENNTPLNRFYHQTTAKYNGHFNAKELLRISLKTYHDSRKEDFYSTLPIFPVPSEKDVKGMLPAIDTAVLKCSKVILNHSMPTAENMFYKSVEYNKWIDENWLTVGEAFFYRRDYQKALDNFEFVKRFFAQDPSTYVASLWIARIYIEQRKYADAKLILDALNERAEIQQQKKIKDYIPFIKEKNPEAGPQMSKKLQFEIHRTFADLALRRREYDLAIEGLKLAIAKCPVAKEKARLNYILAQIYQQQNQLPEAAKCYGRAYKAAAATDIAFNARLNRAVMSGDTRLMADLNKMLKDAKNATYKDQIYYAMALMELNSGNQALAKSHLTSSAFYSNNNKRQRAQSYEKLGDLSFNEKNYVFAQKYYDSSSRFITDDYPNGELIKSKASKLADLVKAIETAQFEDSVQRIAALSEKDREDFLKETLKQIKREEQRRKELEAAKLLALQQSQTTPTTGNANKFIFNNPKLREEGYNDFRKNWGVRENTDDWRRSERIVLNANIDPQGQDTTAQAGQKNVKKDSLSIESLLANIPLTPEALKSSQERLLDALYTSGVLYKEILNESELAAAQYLAILDKKLDHPTDLSAAFQLYKIYENGPDATKYRTYILTKYPNSDAANFFRDPDYYVKQKLSAQKDQAAYLALLEKYEQGYYAQVLSATQPFVDKDLSNAYRAEYLLLNALAFGQLNDNKQLLVPKLQRIIDEKPKSDQAVRAQEMIQTIQKGYSKFELANKKETSIFSTDISGTQYVIVLLDEDEEADELRTAVANFSTKGFKTSKVKVTVKTTVAENNFVLVSDFPSAKIAWDYLNAYKAGFEYLDDYQNNKIYIISQENLKKLIESSKFDDYNAFFIDNY
jgi:tetratricopeptide (TPR) repeat protein